MSSLEQAYTRARAEWKELEEGKVPAFFVGAATCGRAAGAGEVLEKLRSEIKARGMEARVIEVGCLGPCSLEPLVIVHKPGLPRVCYGGVGTKEVVQIIEKFILAGDPCSKLAVGKMTPGELDGIGDFEEHPMLRGQVRNVLRNCGQIDPENINHYLARDGYRGFLRALETGPDKVLEEVKASGLRGRGGAGFPTWRKWDICRKAPGEQKYLICNADEGDPGAFMNRSLIEGDPHSVLEGMLIAALTLGASKGYIYCRAEYPLALKRLEVAIGQMRELGLLGENILGSGFSFDLTIKKGAGAFVCGEETALIASIEGMRGMPRPRPPYPAVSGLWGKPTVIQNVETLGNLPLIMSKGAAWYSQWGTDTSKGTKTFALAGKVNRTGLIEVPMGITLKEVVHQVGGGIPGGKKFKAIQTGGPSGGCLPAEMIELPVDYESLTAAGSIMGSGGMIVLDDETCAVDVAKYFLSFTQEESCGKCPPCRVGTRAMLTLLERIAEGEATTEDMETLEGLAKTVKDGSLCGLGQTAPNPVLTTVRYFRKEYEEHIRKRQCGAFVCEGLVTYYIDPELCSGCRACARACPVEAISGEKDEPHLIDQELCTQCGMCLRTCPDIYAAVYRTSGELTRYEERRERKGKRAARPKQKKLVVHSKTEEPAE